MKVDLSTLPFSCRGSWLAISELGKNWNDCGNEAGLYLRTIHSSAMTPLVARLLPERKEYTAEIRQAALLLTTGDGMLEICFDDPGTMLIRGTSGMRLTLDFLSGSGPYDYIYRFSRNGRTYEMANCFKNNCRYLMSAEQGEAELEQEFLVIQMDVLADLADQLSREKDAADWKDRSDALLKRLLENMFKDGLPVVLKSGNHETVPNESLLPYISIVLGEKLPEPIRNRMTEVLRGGKFRSANGFATESLQSPDYRSDGYWRGPIWAPSTMLLTDGLARCGETELVRDIAARFADLVTVSGFAENFDAVTGDGLRDRSYTWTASAFLAMSHEYL